MLKYDPSVIEEIHAKGSRGIVGYVLGKMSESNPRIIAAYADVGTRFNLVQPMGNRGFQISIAEQSLIGAISGFCHEGFIPFGVAYAPFITMRAADQIRMSAGAMGLGIKIIGGSAGLVSGNLGAASLALDDLSMMRAIPNIIILSPADCLEAAKMLEAACQVDKPVYIRMTGGNSVPPVYKADFEYRIGRANVVACKGNDVVIYATGMQVHSSMQAAELLWSRGIGCTVVDMHTIKPIDQEVINRFSSIPFAVSVEEHNTIGGLGSAIAECLAANPGQRLIRMGVNDFYPDPDSYSALLRRCGLTADQIAERIIEEIECKQGI